MSAAIAIAAFGVVVLITSMGIAVVARRWPACGPAIRWSGVVLAALLWVAHLLLPTFHGPFLLDVVVMAGLYPLVAFEAHKGLGERAFVLSAAIILSVGLVLDVGSWRYGLTVGILVQRAWTVAAFLGPPLVGIALGIMERTRPERTLFAAQQPGAPDKVHAGSLPWPLQVTSVFDGLDASSPIYGR